MMLNLRKTLIVCVVALSLLFSMVFAARFVSFVDVTKCSGCGDCVSVCPVGAIKIFNGKALVDPNKCIGCQFCVSVCQQGAIKIYEQKSKH